MAKEWPDPFKREEAVTTFAGKTPTASDVDQDLITILSWPRGHNGESEKRFCNWIIEKLNKLGHKPTLMEEGAIFMEIETDKGPSKILFSCHTDTVHDSSAKAMQALIYDAEFEHIALDWYTPQSTKKPKNRDPNPVAPKRQRTGSCLGGDNGCGIWIMLKMIEAGVPGGYMFHRGEEKGCVSSRAMAQKRPTWLSRWNAAIAFDRKGDMEVITHQGGGQECCSPEFGKTLATELSIPNAQGIYLQYETSAKGMYTDTYSYRFDIPECTNISCGYYEAHSSDEYVDYGHLVMLKDRALVLDWEALPIKRKCPPKYVAPAPSTAPTKKVTMKERVLSGPIKGSVCEYLLDQATSPEDVELWFEMDPMLASKMVMMALIEAAGFEEQIALIKEKTLF